MTQEHASIDVLISRVREGRTTLGELLERFRAFLLMEGQRRISRRVGARCDASDVVQQTFTDAMEAFGQFAGSGEPQFTAWLRRIHDRNLQDLFRKHAGAHRRSVHREQPFYDADGSASFVWREPAADQSTPSQHVIKGERALRLAHLMESLPEGQRDAVHMRHLEGRRLEEIAEELDRSVSAAAGLIQRGIQALRKKMSEESWM